MKTTSERMRARLRMGKDRPWADVTLRLPVDVLEELVEIAPMLGWSRHTTVMRRYIADGLQRDLNRLQGSAEATLTEKLRANGFSDKFIADAVDAERLHLSGRLVLDRNDD